MADEHCNPEHHCAACDGMTLEDIHEWEQNCLRTNGWYAHMVPGNYHTHGIPMSFNHHPDIQVVLPIDPTIIHSVVSTAVKKIEAGIVFLPGEPVSGIVKDMNVMFVEAKEADNHAVLRMILPDASGNLDAETMDPIFAAQYNDLEEVSCEVVDDE